MSRRTYVVVDKKPYKDMVIQPHSTVDVIGTFSSLKAAQKFRREIVEEFPWKSSYIHCQVCESIGVCRMRASYQTHGDLTVDS